LAHSHPNISAGIPSKKDLRMATTAKMPNIVVSQKEIWVALPNIKEPVKITSGIWWRYYAK